MEPKYEDLNIRRGTDCFRAFRTEVPKFEFNWHYHPEHEITYIENGSGKRLIGDNYENFEPGDLIMVGKGLPHTWASDLMDKGPSSAIVIQFSEDILQSLLNLSEFEAIKKLLYNARLGLYFPSQNASDIIGLIQNLPSKTGPARIIALLTLINALCDQKPVPLASAYFQPVRGDLNEKRITTVCRYIQENAAGKIDISHAAGLVHLSKSAFCKFFKRTTGKTFSDYVNEIRVGHACQLLAGSDKTIADVCYSSGFESPTYFNRIFLRKKRLRPGDFRNRK